MDYQPANRVLEPKNLKYCAMPGAKTLPLRYEEYETYDNNADTQIN